MIKSLKITVILFFLTLLFNVVSVTTVPACKDIISVGNVNEGDYNLLMKVRDPSRSGLQVLSIIPESYEYTYNHPRNGKEMTFTTEYKFIGGGTEGDTIPNIPKFGMSLSDAGLAYTDSDSGSSWINYRRYAWDDFDCMRYACQKANNEEEAMQLLTKDIVDELHASAVSENFFVVGPNKGYLIEEDAYRYKVEEIENGISIRHNYAKLLWKSQVINLVPIAKDFDKVVEKEVKKRNVVRLGSLFGVRITDIGDNFITVSPVGMIHTLATNNFKMVNKINISERKTVGYFSVELKNINGNKALVRVTNVYKAWEEEMLKRIYPYNGSINPKKMMEWSRLTTNDLDGLRGINQDNYEFENVVIYKIPKTNYETMSMGWYVPNHARSSIYIPFHISNTDIYNKYETTEAAQLSLDLLNLYEEKTIEEYFEEVEEVFLNEIEEAEEISINLIAQEKVFQDFLTIIDTSMQRQAYQTQILWKQAYNNNNIQNILSGIWDKSYKESLSVMEKAINYLKNEESNEFFINSIKELSIGIVESRINAAEALGKNVSYAKIQLNKCNYYFESDDDWKAFDCLDNAYSQADAAIHNEKYYNYRDSDNIASTTNNNFLFFLILLVLVIILLISFSIIIFNKKNKK